MDGSDITGAFTRKLGPLPAWGWAAVIVGGLYGYNAWQNRGTSAPLSPTDQSLGVQDGVPADFSGAAGGSNGDSVFSPSLPVSGSPSPTTNQQWAIIAGDWLTGLGVFSPSVIQTALNKYITGVALTPQEKAIVNQALQAFKSPPEGPLGTVDVPPPPATTPGTVGTAAMQTIPRGRSMYDAARSAHPTANAAQANDFALRSIHYNIAHGITPWPRGVPGPALTQWKMRGNTRVYVL